MDLAIEGDGHALLQLAPDPRIAGLERADHAADVVRLDFKLLHPARVLGEAGRQDDPRQGAQAPPLAPPLSIASKSLGGDIGRSVMRMPVAFSIALATAAMGGTIGVSPTPRTP